MKKHGMPGSQWVVAYLLYGIFFLRKIFMVPRLNFLDFIWGGGGTIIIILRKNSTIIKIRMAVCNHFMSHVNNVKEEDFIKLRKND